MATTRELAITLKVQTGDAKANVQDLETAVKAASKSMAKDQIEAEEAIQKTRKQKEVSEAERLKRRAKEIGDAAKIEMALIERQAKEEIAIEGQTEAKKDEIRKRAFGELNASISQSLNALKALGDAGAVPFIQLSNALDNTTKRVETGNTAFKQLIENTASIGSKFAAANAQMDTLVGTLKKMESAGQKDTAQYKALQQQLGALSGEAGKLEAQMKSLEAAGKRQASGIAQGFDSLKKALGPVGDKLGGIGTQMGGLVAQTLASGDATSALVGGLGATLSMFGPWGQAASVAVGILGAMIGNMETAREKSDRLTKEFQASKDTTSMLSQTLGDLNQQLASPSPNLQQAAEGVRSKVAEIAKQSPIAAAQIEHLLNQPGGATLKDLQEVDGILTKLEEKSKAETLAKSQVAYAQALEASKSKLNEIDQSSGGLVDWLNDAVEGVSEWAGGTSAATTEVGQRLSVIASEQSRLAAEGKQNTAEYLALEAERNNFALQYGELAKLATESLTQQVAAGKTDLDVQTERQRIIDQIVEAQGGYNVITKSTLGLITEQVTAYTDILQAQVDATTSAGQYETAQRMTTAAVDEQVKLARELGVEDSKAAEDKQKAAEALIQQNKALIGQLQAQIEIQQLVVDGKISEAEAQLRINKLQENSNQLAKDKVAIASGQAGSGTKALETTGVPGDKGEAQARIDAAKEQIKNLERVNTETEKFIKGLDKSGEAVSAQAKVTDDLAKTERERLRVAAGQGDEQAQKQLESMVASQLAAAKQQLATMEKSGASEKDLADQKKKVLELEKESASIANEREKQSAKAEDELQKKREANEEKLQKQKEEQLKRQEAREKAMADARFQQFQTEQAAFAKYVEGINQAITETKEFNKQFLEAALSAARTRFDLEQIAIDAKSPLAEAEALYERLKADETAFASALREVQRINTATADQQAQVLNRLTDYERTQQAGRTLAMMGGRNAPTGAQTRLAMSRLGGDQFNEIGQAIGVQINNISQFMTVFGRLSDDQVEKLQTLGKAWETESRQSIAAMQSEIQTSDDLAEQRTRLTTAEKQLSDARQERINQEVKLGQMQDAAKEAGEPEAIAAVLKSSEDLSRNLDLIKEGFQQAAAAENKLLAADLFKDVSDQFAQLHLNSIPAMEDIEKILAAYEQMGEEGRKALDPETKVSLEALKKYKEEWQAIQHWIRLAQEGRSTALAAATADDTANEKAADQLKKFQETWHSIAEALQTSDLGDALGNVATNAGSMVENLRDGKDVFKEVASIAATSAGALANADKIAEQFGKRFKEQGAGGTVQEGGEIATKVGTALLDAPPPLNMIGAVILAAGFFATVIGKLITAFVGREKTAVEVAEDRAATERLASEQYQNQIAQMEQLNELGHESVDTAAERLALLKSEHEILTNNSDTAERAAALTNKQLTDQIASAKMLKSEREDLLRTGERSLELGRDDRKAWLESQGIQVQWWQNTSFLVKDQLEKLKAQGIIGEEQLATLEQELDYRKAIKEESKQVRESLISTRELLVDIALRSNRYAAALHSANASFSVLVSNVNQALGKQFKTADEMMRFLNSQGFEYFKNLSEQQKAVISEAMAGYETLGDSVFEDAENLINLRKEAGKFSEDEQENAKIAQDQLLELYQDELQRLIDINATEEEKLALEIKIRDLMKEQNEEADIASEKLTKLVHDRQELVKAQRAGRATESQVAAQTAAIRAELAAMGKSPDEIQAFIDTLPQHAEGGPATAGPALLHGTKDRPEYIVNANAVNKYGLDFMERLNSMQFPLPFSPGLQGMAATIIQNRINTVVTNNMTVNGTTSESIQRWIAGEMTKLRTDIPAIVQKGITQGYINVKR